MNVTPVSGYRPRVLVAATLLVLGVLPAQAAPILAMPSNEASAASNGGINMTVEDPCTAPLVWGAVPQGAGCESGSGSGSFSSRGSATAGNGSVHAGAMATAYSVGTTSFYANSRAYGSSTDYFAIQGPANAWAQLNGSFVLGGGVDVQVSGAADAYSTGLASYSFDGSLTGGGYPSGSGSLVKGTNGFEESSNVSGGIFPVTSGFRFGPDGWAEFMISMRVSLTAEGYARPSQQCSDCPVIPGAFSAEAAFGNTLYWGGIDSITVDGNVLADYEYLASASGVDYRYSTAVVPVPAASWLFSSGLLGLFGALRRRRQLPA